MNEAFVTAKVIDEWSSPMLRIENATKKATKVIKEFEQVINGLDQNFVKATQKLDSFSKHFSSLEKKVLGSGLNANFTNIAKSLNSLNLKFNKGEKNVSSFISEFDKLRNIQSFNVESLLHGDLKKYASDVKTLNNALLDQKGIPVKNIPLGSAPLSGKTKLMPIEQTEERPRSRGLLLADVLQAETIRRGFASAITNAKDFDSALFDIQKQLGDGDNLQEYINLINKYSLSTGRSTVEVSGFVAELIKTRAAGEGLDSIASKLDAMTFATKNLDVPIQDASKSLALLNNAFNFDAERLNAFLSILNDIEDVYQTVSGAQVLEIVSRISPSLLKNAKLLSQEQAIVLSTFAQANTVLDAGTVGNNLNKVLTPIIKIAEEKGQSVFDLLGQIAKEYNALGSTASKQAFISSLVGTKDMQALQVIEGLLTERLKIRDIELEQAKRMQIAYREGEIGIKQYIQALSGLNPAEMSIIKSLQTTKEAKDQFDKILGLLSDSHESTLGRISQSWFQISTALGNTVFPVLDKLGDGLSVVTPYIVSFIENNKGFVSGLLAIAGVFGVLKTASLFFGGGVFATMLTNLTRLVSLFANLTKFAGIVGGAAVLGALSNPIALGTLATTVAVGGGILAYKKFTTKEDQVTQGTKEQPVNLNILQSKETQDRFLRAIDEKMTYKYQPPVNATPIIPQFLDSSGIGLKLNRETQPQLSPFNFPSQKGAIDVNINVEGNAEVDTRVIRQDNISLDVLNATKTRML